MNRIVVNGQRIEVPAGWRIADLLLDLGFQDRRVAVEKNGSIVPRSQHESSPIQAEDRIEIVVAVGGG
ncbi:MAG: sulfur carrier protein ThiS [Rhodocyclaceae bacterium]|nr:sulfur carrier protein ThiS [Rhodocyclaceae bacterium]